MISPRARPGAGAGDYHRRVTTNDPGLPGLPVAAAALAASVRSCPVFRDAAAFAAAGGVPAMGRPWAFAAGAGLLGAGAGVTDDTETVERWLAGVSTVLASETEDGEDDGALLLALAVLGAVKAREDGRLRGPFWEVVRVRLQDLCDRAGTRFPFRTRRRYAGQRWGRELPGLVRLLSECGLLAPDGTDPDGVPDWTDLGRWAYRALPGAVPWPDPRWLAVERAAMTLEQDNPDEALSILWEALDEDDLDATVAAVEATGHPDAETVVQRVAAFMESGAPRSVEQALDLAVLASEAPGGRSPLRVQVPAIFTLADLHDVLADRFGGDDGQPYRFTVGEEHCGPGEAERRLGAALAPTRWISYARGQEEFEIKLERRVRQDPGREYPYWADASLAGAPSDGKRPTSDADAV